MVIQILKFLYNTLKNIFHLLWNSGNILIEYYFGYLKIISKYLYIYGVEYLSLLRKFLYKNLFIVSCSFLVIFTGISGKFYYDATNYFENFVDYIPPTNTIYDRNQKLIGFSSMHYSCPVKIHEIPTLLKDTILLVEDKYFYSHCGISFDGYIRAIINFIPSLLKGERPMGGSGITQQLVRSIALNQNLSLFRKWKESMFAIAMTRKFSKDYILTTYINNAYFGNNIYGFSAAARFFFEKKLDELNSMEIATLVAMLKGAITISPLVNPGRAKSRLSYILDLMHKNGYIDDLAYEDYKNTQLDLSYITKPTSYLTMYIRELIIKEYGREKYSEGGLIINTTIDKNLQTLAESTMQNHCYNFERARKWNGPIGKMNEFNSKKLYDFHKDLGYLYIAVMMIDSNGSYKTQNGQVHILSSEEKELYLKYKSIEPGDVVILNRKHNTLCNAPVYTGQITILNTSGEILAMVGGVDLLHSQYNLLDNKRTIGSMIKIFNGITLLEKGITPETMVRDEPGQVVGHRWEYIDYKKWIANQNIDNRSSYETLGVWPVNNWDCKFFGPISFRNSFEHSRNIPFVYLILEHAKLSALKNTLVKFNIVDNKQTMFPSIILGSLELNHREITSAICSIVNNYYTPVNVINSVSCNNEDITNKPVISYTKEPLMKPYTRFALLSMMHGVIYRGSGSKLKTAGNFIYGKSGSSAHNRDGQYIAINGKYILYASICRYDNKSICPSESTASVYGSDYPARIITDLIKNMNISEIDYLADRTMVKSKKMSYNPYNSKNILDKNGNIIIEEFEPIL